MTKNRASRQCLFTVVHSAPYRTDWLPYFPQDSLDGCTFQKKVLAFSNIRTAGCEPEAQEPNQSLSPCTNVYIQFLYTMSSYNNDPTFRPNIRLLGFGIRGIMTPLTSKLSTEFLWVVVFTQNSTGLNSSLRYSWHTWLHAKTYFSFTL